MPDLDSAEHEANLKKCRDPFHKGEHFFEWHHPHTNDDLLMLCSMCAAMVRSLMSPGSSQQPLFTEHNRPKPFKQCGSDTL